MQSVNSAGSETITSSTDDLQTGKIMLQSTDLSVFQRTERVRYSDRNKDSDKGQGLTDKKRQALLYANPLSANLLVQKHNHRTRHKIQTDHT